MKTYILIKKLLTQYPELRSDDKALQWKMFEIQGKLVNGFLSYQGFKQAKSTETVRRTRQKLQEKHPELQANSQIQEIRKTIQNTKGTWIFRDNTAYFQPQV